MDPAHLTLKRGHWQCRDASYHMFIHLKYGVLGHGEENRCKPPDCVITCIHMNWPDLDGQYAGYTGPLLES